VGITYGKTLAAALGKPLVPVNHLAGHVHAVFLEAYKTGRAAKLPAVCLIVSGGHTVLYEVTAGDSVEPDGGGLLSYRKIGQTRDDAAGEAYDKVAKLLGLGYPGGPILDRLAAVANGAAAPVKFGPTKTRGNPLDFSFSGLKTAVLRWVQSHAMQTEIEARRDLLRRTPAATDEEWIAVTPQATLDLLASFQHAVITELLTRAAASAAQIEARSLIISGGVACNSGLRTAARLAHLPYPVHFPSPGLSTDNAAMIGAAAFPKLVRRDFAGFDTLAQANLTLA
jgi:N6-L-threonylcarbamoyladenine synthase